MSIELLHEWQTLIGSIIGPFLAITLSSTVLWYEYRTKKKKDQREAIRRAEIAFAQTLTHMNIAVTQLEEFIQRIHQVIAEVKTVKDPNQYSIHGANFPATIKIHFDEDLIKMKFKSYYVHNKLLITDFLVKTSNDTIGQFKYDFERLLDQNERIADPAMMSPTNQRATFIENLGNYIKIIEKFTHALKTKYSKSIAKAKIYNLKLMKHHLYTLWKYEGKFRYFKNREVMEKFNGSMDAVDRIDGLMEKEAVELMDEVQKRAEQAEREESKNM
ncbi:hypothetical protein JW758_00125 [Candidatus Peregrinibacteria bacterium]|nr:hypothetical protein [Candidatus Peregrinibacteria bacterium]